MIKAVADKLIVKLMKMPKERGGLILPESAADPQAFGLVLSVGESIDTIEEGNIVVFHPMAGMDMMVTDELMKTLKYEEVYGVLTDSSVAETLEGVTFGAPKEKSKIIS